MLILCSFQSIIFKYFFGWCWLFLWFFCTFLLSYTLCVCVPLPVFRTIECAIVYIASVYSIQLNKHRTHMRHTRELYQREREKKAPIFFFFFSKAMLFVIGWFNLRDILCINKEKSTETRYTINYFRWNGKNHFYIRVTACPKDE